MEVSERGVALIASFEGFSSVLYDDPVGHCTIGYGFLVHLGNCDNRLEEQPYLAGISEEAALRLLREKIQGYAAAVERTTRPLNQNEFDALTSLCYNIGPGGYLNSSVRQAVNTGGDVCGELRKVVHGTDGVTYPGLVRRREAECELFNTPEDAMKQEELDRLDNVERQVASARADLNALANGQDALPSLKGQLRYLWALAGKAWPF